MRHFYIILLTCLAISCASTKNSKEIVQQISMESQSGGKGSRFYKLSINKDSIVYESGNRSGSQKKTVAKTSFEIWEKLAKIDLDEFDKIKSTQSQMLSDGSDETINIVTNKKSHSVTNGYFNTTALRNFVSELRKIISQ